MRLLRIISRNFSTNLRELYQVTIKDKGMVYDDKQIKVIHKLQKFNDDLISTHPSWKKHARALTDQPAPAYVDMSTKQQKQVKKKNFFSIFSREFSTSPSIRVKGLYLFGGSGSGKSFLSDMFYNRLAIEQKTRVHFHQFMADIHADLFTFEKQHKGSDPLNFVAKKIAKKTRLLYLDEFQVTDVADASILKRLFERLINNQLVLLATTNRKPEDLYKNGHQREFFLPFIDFINQKCSIMDINSQKDYRYDMERDSEQVNVSYLSPIDQVSEAKINRIVQLLTKKQNPVLQETTLQPITGRKLVIPRACDQVCIYYFHQLMENVMGDSDFRAICKNFKAIIIRNMRQIKQHQKNTANRLIKLFDEAYYRNVKIYIEASVGASDLINPLPEKEVTSEQDFAMIRCKSRLMQFQTKQYKERLSEVEKVAKGIKIDQNEETLIPRSE